MTLPRLLSASLLACALSHCSNSDRREYQAPTSAHALKPLQGTVLGLHYTNSPTGGEVSAHFLGAMMLDSLSAPLMVGANGAHVPTFDVRVVDGRVIRVTDDDAPPLARGSRVVLMPSGAGYRILPDTRR